MRGFFAKNRGASSEPFVKVEERFSMLPSSKELIDMGGNYLAALVLQLQEELAELQSK